jgi:DNA-binding response OmpR family regulator
MRGMENTLSAPRIAASPHAGGRGKAFLVLSDDGDTILRQLIPSILEAHAFACICAGSDQEAARVLASGRRLLGLIADTRVYTRRGYEWVRRIRERLPGLPALIIGGHGDEGTLDPETAAAGPTDILCIPFSPAQVIERVRLLASPAAVPQP